MIDDPILTSKSVLAVVITYNPDCGIAQLVNDLRPHVASVLIIDNASANQTSTAAETRGAGCDFIPNKENIGVAAALNQAMARAVDVNFEWVLTMDQDSMPLPGMLSAARAALGSYHHRQDVGIIGANYIGPNGSPCAPADVTTGYTEQAVVITSGSLTNVRAWRTVGGFADDLFIDSVDHEYCLRLRRYGFAVLQATALGLQHRIGAPVLVKTRRGASPITRHSPLRRYYITRNLLAVVARYGAENRRWALHAIRHLARELWFIVRHEDGKTRKLLASLLGTLHAASGRRGRLDSRFLS